MFDSFFKAHWNAQVVSGIINSKYLDYVLNYLLDIIRSIWCTMYEVGLKSIFEFKFSHKNGKHGWKIIRSKGFKDRDIFHSINPENFPRYIAVSYSMIFSYESRPNKN